MSNKNKTYTEAVIAIEEILQQIETGEMDIDELAEKVKQASELLKFCKGKLFQTEKEIDKILKEMEGSDEGPENRD
jgi:exodeoxyribonuclease VII small subunit